MDFSARTIWAMTKMFAFDPTGASRAVLAARLPLNVSVLMIVLAAVMSSVFSGIQLQFVELPTQTVQLVDGREVAIVMAGPLQQGLLSVILGLVFGYSLFAIGKRFGGTGSLAAIMSIIAMLQIALVVIEAAVFVSFFILPLVTQIVWLFGFIVLLRGLTHGVNVGHEFGTVAKAAVVVVLGALGSVVALGFIAGLTGLGFDLELI